jgi:D-glycero-D-manno-heptose 1,7-bisphosphate phosphatase
VTVAANKVVILDRDGTLVVDRPYQHDPDGLEFEAGAAEGLRWLHRRGYRLVVITNQSGIGRGLFSAASLDAVHLRLQTMVGVAGAQLAGIYACPHAPEAGCNCRKPEQALMQLAAAELGFDPRTAFVIGDKESDVEFGRRAGAMSILLAPPGSEVAGRSHADAIAPNLLAAARLVTSSRV